MANKKTIRSVSLVLAIVISMCAFLTACGSGNDTIVSEYTVINQTSSDVSIIVDALGAGYINSAQAANIESSGKNIIVCIAKNGQPYDLSSFNDDGYIIRRIDDDIIICAKNEQACQLAMKRFVGNYVYTSYNEEGQRVGLIYFANEINYVHGAADKLGKVTIGGVNIEDYKIVIPSNSFAPFGNMGFEPYAAEMLQDHLYNAGGIKIDIITDSEPEGEHEIVIGKTSRSESPSDIEYDSMEYYFEITEDDIIMDGTAFMVCGGVGKLIADYLEPEDCGDVAIDDIIEGGVVEYEAREADSVIMIIGDGMGANHIKMARKEQYLGFDGIFYASSLPSLGKIITASQDVFDGTEDCTDSAASGTALSSGFKTYNSMIGLDASGNMIPNVRDLAYATGARTAVITTDSLDGATPSAYISHSTDRNDGEQLEAWYPYETLEYVRASIGDGLLDHTMAAIHSISESGDDFFIMIEEAYTDKAAHSNDMTTVCEAVARINDCIAYCLSYAVAHTDTVVIITADHETGGIKWDDKNDIYDFTTGNHTNVDVPIYALGDGTEYFNNTVRDNTTVASFIAKIFGDDDFGHLAHSIK